MNRFFPNIILSILIVWSILSMYNYVGIFQNLISPNIVTATSILTYLIESIAIYLVATKFNIFFKSSLCKTVIFWLLYTSIICLFTSELFYFDIREVLWFPSIFIIFYYIGITDNKTNNNIKHIFKYTLLILLPINLLLYELILSLPYFSLSGNYASSNQIFYIILLIMFSLGQFGCSLFSTYAISVIQARTPEHLMGKIMSYVFTLAMCAQPAGQIIYGALFDWFSDSPYWVLIPSGLLVCVIGLASSRFFVNFEKN